MVKPENWRCPECMVAGGFNNDCDRCMAEKEHYEGKAMKRPDELGIDHPTVIPENYDANREDNS